MAFTLSMVINTTIGNRAYQIVDVTPDATTGTFSPGLANLHDVQLHYRSAAVSAVPPRIGINEGALGTSIQGSIAMTSAVANAVYRLAIWGTA